MDDVSDIRQHYDSDPQKEEKRLEQHPLEYEITWRYLRDYLPPGGTILEIGCAAGAYTLELGRSGYRMVAVDMSAVLVETLREHVRRDNLGSVINCYVADARDLSEVPGADYDAVLLMGPLYHLIDIRDRKRAVREAVARLRTGGVFVSSHISRFGMMAHIAATIPEWIEADEVNAVLLRGCADANQRDRNGFRGYFAVADELRPLHEEFGLRTLVVATADPASAVLDPMFREMPEHHQRLWSDLLYGISAKPTYLDSSSHLLYIGEKR